MDFIGIEKLSLLDFDKNISCTLFAGGCPFRCPYCHNAYLVLEPHKAKKIPWSDIMEYLSKRKGILDSVCISGGEPTDMPGLLDKLADIKSLGYLIKLDTNGTRPDVVRIAYEQGLIDYVAMDIKGSFEEYPEIVGVSHPDIESIKETAIYLMTSGIDYEFRCTMLDEYLTEEDIEKMGLFLVGAKRMYLQRYIYSESCIGKELTPVSKEKAEQYASALRKYIKEVSLRGYK